MSTSGLLELHALSQKILISGMYINKGYINVSYSFFYIIVVSISIQSNLQFHAVFFFFKPKVKFKFNDFGINYTHTSKC